MQLFDAYTPSRSEQRYKTYMYLPHTNTRCKPITVAGLTEMETTCMLTFVLTLSVYETCFQILMFLNLKRVIKCIFSCHKKIN